MSIALKGLLRHGLKKVNLSAGIRPTPLKKGEQVDNHMNESSRPLIRKLTLPEKGAIHA
jgi:hypothetical protein